MGEFRVKAEVPGFYGKIREAGEQFDLQHQGDLGSWMAPVGWSAEVEAESKPAPKGNPSQPPDLDDRAKAELQARYKKLHPEGKRPFGGWDEDELKRRIEALEQGE